MAMICCSNNNNNNYNSNNNNNNLLRMKIKQLVIFTILNYISIRKYLHNFKKTELYDQ